MLVQRSRGHVRKYYNMSLGLTKQDQEAIKTAAYHLLAQKSIRELTLTPSGAKAPFVCTAELCYLVLQCKSLSIQIVGEIAPSRLVVVWGMEP